MTQEPKANLFNFQEFLGKFKNFKNEKSEQNKKEIDEYIATVDFDNKNNSLYLFKELFSIFDRNSLVYHQIYLDIKEEKNDLMKKLQKKDH